MSNNPHKAYATTWRDTVVRRFGARAMLRRTMRDMTLRVKSWLDTKDESTFLRCLACHHVFDDQRTEFLRLIQMLKHRGQFIDTETCLAMAEGNNKIDGRYFHLSFDDGYRNVIRNALPILCDEQVPMIMFAPTHWIGSDWDNAAHFSLEIAEYRDVLEMATWDDLRQMITNGFDVGSHTKTHVRLASLSNEPESLDDELRGSKAEIETQLGRPCTTIAYPYGKPGDYDSTTFQQTKAAGYRAGFGIHRGTVVGGRTPMMLIPRHHFEAEWPVPHVRYFANGNMEEYWRKHVGEQGQPG
ncbi:polysaccharide deacetylase family protein [Rubripirellula amarantea]|nr:polysaccharide deacetylase family protein [Rubripirellula amarantea]